MTKFELTKYKIKETGADGGHKYISAIVDFNGNERDITIIFKDKIE
ncbi:hypothetical protein BC643_4560 [Mangrovibacterium diazotrophicum]|uniref:Uncharacterized protein n=1 Tax=Mangrovibacterium diazotrophicum TaxID=1261403 RepID=A0A419VU64_9BACT|nr:hypothetical protein BC643_4560 [Mangrovibacterium diazotrophicum]